jgi:hypothetical protein
VIIGGRMMMRLLCWRSIQPTGNLFVAGEHCQFNFPGNKSGSKYPTFQGGVCDGFVAEFTNNGTFVRDGFFGTSGNDIIYGIQFDKFGFPYISGTTTGSLARSECCFQPGRRQTIHRQSKT